MFQKHTKSVNHGEITMHTDNEYITKEYCNNIHEESNCAKEARGIVDAIRNKLKGIGHKASFECSNTKVYPQKEFSKQPGPVLMKCCNEKSKEDQKQLKLGELNQKIEHNSEIVPLVKGKTRDKTSTF